MVNLGWGCCGSFSFLSLFYCNHNKKAILLGLRVHSALFPFFFLSNFFEWAAFCLCKFKLLVNASSHSGGC